MVVIELDVDEGAAQQLQREAATFEFGDVESYVRWLVEHRAVTLDGTELQRERTEELAQQVGELTAAVETLREEVEATDDGDENARAGIDWMLLQTESADDEAVEAAIPTIDETLDDEMDL